MSSALERSDGSLVNLGDIHLGSDDVSYDYKRVFGGITIEKSEVPLGYKEWFNGRTWIVEFRAIPKTKVESLRNCYEDGVCFLRPNSGSETVRYKVMLMGNFDPEYIAPDKYNLSLVLKETP